MKKTIADKHTTPGSAGEKQGKGVSRRAFFSGASVVAVGAAAVPFVSGRAGAQQAAGEGEGTRYQETDHVRRYYETNRY